MTVRSGSTSTSALQGEKHQCWFENGCYAVHPIINHRHPIVVCATCFWYSEIAAVYSWVDYRITHNSNELSSSFPWKLPLQKTIKWAMPEWQTHLSMSHNSTSSIAHCPSSRWEGRPASFQNWALPKPTSRHSAAWRSDWKSLWSMARAAAKSMHFLRRLGSASKGKSSGDLCAFAVCPTTSADAILLSSGS